MITYYLMALRDLPEVLSLERQCFTEPWSAGMFRDELNSPLSSTVLARDENRRLVGFACYWVFLEEMHLMNVAVAKDRRRQGIGMGLVVEAMKLASAKGAASATLEVRSRNVAAVAMYERLGFLREGLRRDYYTDPDDDAVIMWARDMAETLNN